MYGRALSIQLLRSLTLTRKIRIVLLRKKKQFSNAYQPAQEGQTVDNERGANQIPPTRRSSLRGNQLA